jgi:3-methylfumaryl-CoA hydratase
VRRAHLGVSEDYSTWVGRSVERTDVASERLIASYRATLRPYLFEEKTASICPPGLHWALAPAMLHASEIGPDGAEARGLFLPPVTLQRRMWAGGAIETTAPIPSGAIVTRLSTISSVRQAQGRSGPLCFISVTHDFALEGKIAISERQDLVFRESLGSDVAQTSSAVRRDTALNWNLTADPLLLFRFSALTFNGHRIHYDVDYARETEGYRGLVVHGPLQAALLLNQSAISQGRVPHRFDYRCIAPLIAGSSLTVETSGVEGRIFDAEGRITCEARSSP